MERGKIWRLALAFGFIASIFLVNFEADRTNFSFIASFYALAFVFFILIIRERNSYNFSHLIILAGAAHFVSMLYAPNLSDDYYRFLWDGELTWSGINVFDFTPIELHDQGYMQTAYLKDLYVGMSDLSKDNYSCYPPVNQLYFIVSSGFTSSVATNVFIMKLLIVLTEIGGLIYLRKLFLHFNIEPTRLWLLFMNPLLIIECTGNVHFEGVMISLLCISFYFLFTKKNGISALIFGLAVQIKLVPLLLLLFLLRYMGWKKAFLYYIVSGFVIVGLGMTMIYPRNVMHFLESLSLYFRVFEFNSFIFYNYIEFGKLFVDYNPVQIIGPILSGATMITIVFYSFGRKSRTWQQLVTRMMFGFFLYMFFGSTLHPWYVLPLLTLSLFTNYTFPVLWSFLIFFSYFFYSVGDGSSFEVRALVTIEYIILLIYLVIELKQKGSPFKNFRLESYFQPRSES
ncbi:MAG: glycosyltransferase 87 family protein [Crocinitomicaceae bacterium]|nr:glycosyltransferase 87 family protein [Crocinitomicaceae bacterium]MDG1658066.1 glycosyltransferase 87 family protein [Crocinitomicaceae bacterium]MDG2440452.1 glycosyltransferase 87 family protein [Crocinitomicaceae bacterium]